MKLQIEISNYSKESGFQYDWCKGFQINTLLDNNTFVLSANKEGLESLAKQLLLLSQMEVPTHLHLHYDDYNCLEEGSIPFVIEKI